MKPLYKHIIQTIEAPFLDAYGERISAYENTYTKPVSLEIGYHWDDQEVSGDPAVGTQLSFTSGTANNFGQYYIYGMIELNKGDKITFHATTGSSARGCHIIGSYDEMSAGTTVLAFTPDADEDVSWTAPSYCGVCLLMESSIEEPFKYTIRNEGSIPTISYKAILVNKDDRTKKSDPISSAVHVLNSSKPTSNENALVYFNVEDSYTHSLNDGDKLILEIYRDDRTEYWTSKSAAFKVQETSITHT